MKCEICQRDMIRFGRYRNKKGLWQRYKCQHCAIIRFDAEPIKE